MTKVARYRFTEPNDYAAGFDEGEADLVVSGIGRFYASCDDIDTERLRIVVGEEQRARVAYVKLHADGLLTFPMTKASTLIVRGEAVRFGELMWLAPASRFHERITGHTQWGRIRLSSPKLSNPVRRWAPPSFLSPASGQLIVPDRAYSEMLLAAVRNATALARMDANHASSLWEMVQSIEQVLQQVLTKSASDQAQSPPNKTSERHHEIMLRLEHLLTERLQHPLQLPSIAEALQISERTLRTCCEEHLGIGLHRYLRLRRLKLTRHYLSRSDARTTSVAAVARRYGFLDLGRFAATYHHAFGELPSATLARLRRPADLKTKPK